MKTPTQVIEIKTNVNLPVVQMLMTHFDPGLKETRRILYSISCCMLYLSFVINDSEMIPIYHGKRVQLSK